ncbi:MAG: Zn-ribbon domain-containing OB-fold protein [Betaproteobacteria bacterium]
MSTPWQARIATEPAVYPETEAFWQAANEGRLLLKRCVDCGQFHWYPRAICPFCASDRTEWVQASGKAVVYSVTVSRKSGPVPYALAYVTLEEGVTMLSNIVECDLDAVRIGDAVELTFVSTAAGHAIPVFRPA